MAVPSEFLNSLFIRNMSPRMTGPLQGFKVEYVWGAPWTVVKATFLLNRYGNLIGQSVVALEEMGNLSHGSEEFCEGFTLFAAVFMIFPAESIHILMRAWAIWGCTYRVAVWLILLHAVYILVGVGMMVHTATTANLVNFQYLDEVPPFKLVVRALSDVDGPHCFAGKCLQQLVYDRMLNIVSPPLNSWTASRTQPPGVQTRQYTTRDLSREVDRQMAAMGGTSFWEAVDQPNGVHVGGPRGPEWSESSGATPMTDVELEDVCLATPAAAAALDIR
ncbi:hypothetical protein BU15DRAFT_66318 [Melanogaster broomeanus]|nr:hypothetical protein BU15DRAFT_66318 [Melanogaster broomeanus]